MTALNDQLVEAVLADWQTAPIDDKLRTTLAFLEKLTVPEGKVSIEEIQTMRQVGVSEQAIEDAIYVCFAFNVLTRLADAFDFDMLTPEQFQEGAKSILRFSYQLTSM